MSINPNRVQEVFSAAVASADPVERAEILKKHCAGDAVLRERVEELLRAHHQATKLPGGFRDIAGGFCETMIDSRAAPAGRMIGGRYRLLEEIGEGGMGTVLLRHTPDPTTRSYIIDPRPILESTRKLSGNG